MISNSIKASKLHLTRKKKYRTFKWQPSPQGLLSYLDGDENFSSPSQYDKRPWGRGCSNGIRRHTVDTREGHLTWKVKGVCGKISPHPVSYRIKNAPKVNPIAFCQNPLFQGNSKNVLPHDTLPHNFLINGNTLSNNFYQKGYPVT